MPTISPTSAVAVARIAPSIGSPVVWNPAGSATIKSSIPSGYRGTVRDAQFPPKVVSPPTANSASARGFATGGTLHAGQAIPAVPADSIAVVAPKALAGGGTSFAGATASCFGFAVATIAQPMAVVAPPSAISLAAVGDPATEVAGDVFPGATSFALAVAGSPIIESGTPGEVFAISAQAIFVVAQVTSPNAGVTVSPPSSIGLAEAPATAANVGVSATVAAATASSMALAARPTVSVVANLTLRSGEATCAAPLTGVTIIRPWVESASLGFVPVIDQD